MESCNEVPGFDPRKQSTLVNDNVKAGNGQPTHFNAVRMHPEDLNQIIKELSNNWGPKSEGFSMNSGPKSMVSQESEEDLKIRSFVGGLLNEVFTHFHGKPELQDKVVREFRRQMAINWNDWREREYQQQEQFNSEINQTVTSLSNALAFNEFSK